MSKYGKVPRELWHEPWFRSAAGNVRELALYLLTGPRSLSIPGVTLARAAVVADDLGWSSKRMRVALAALTDLGWVEVDQEAGVMFVPSALMQRGLATEINKPGSLNAAVGWVLGLDDIPTGPARDRIIEVMTAHGDQLGGEFPSKIRRARAKATPRLADGKGQAVATQIRTEQNRSPEGAPVLELRRQQAADPDPEPPAEVVIGGVPVAGELAAMPGMTNLLERAFRRFGPVQSEHEADPDLARRRS